MYREASNGNARKKTFSEGTSNFPDLDLDLACPENNCLHVQVSGNTVNKKDFIQVLMLA